jgi:hypothetical protein
MGVQAQPPYESGQAALNLNRRALLDDGPGIQVTKHKRGFGPKGSPI